MHPFRPKSAGAKLIDCALWKRRPTKSRSFAWIARSPAPSWAALSWLETSIRAYSKYIDVVAKSLKDEETEQEMVKRERLAIDEIRSLLAEMLKDANSCRRVSAN